MRLAGVTRLRRDDSGGALLEPIRVVSVALFGSMHLLSADEGAQRGAQRGHQCVSE